MTTLLRLALYLVAGASCWLALVVAIGTVVHGRAWVWTQTRESWRQHTRHRARERRLLGERVPASRDQPVALAPRGGWL